MYYPRSLRVDAEGDVIAPRGNTRGLVYVNEDPEIVLQLVRIWYHARKAACETGGIENLSKLADAEAALASWAGRA